MMAGRSLRHWALASMLITACSLTESLDELGENAGGRAGDGAASGTSGFGGSAGWVSSGGLGGSPPDGSSGVGGANGGSAGNDGGTAGSSATGGSPTGGGGGSGGAVSKDPPWWQTSWPKRVQLTVSNNSDATLPADFELGFAIDPSAVFGSSLTSFELARRTSIGWTLLPHYVEQVSGTTWLWTALPASIAAGATDTSLWLYAGDPAGGSQSNPLAVFSFWDGFESATGAWDATYGVPLFQGGTLVLTNHSSVRSTATVGVDHAVDFRMVVNVEVSPPWDWICGGFQRVSDFENIDPWLLWIARPDTPGTIQAEAKVSAISLDKVGTQQTLTLGQSRLYGIERFATKTVYRRDQQVITTHTSPFYSANLQLRFTAQSTAGKATFDFVRVRRVADPPPSVGFGSAESYP